MFFVPWIFHSCLDDSCFSRKGRGMLSVWWLWPLPAVSVSSCWMQFLVLQYSVHYVVLHAHLSCAMKCSRVAQRSRGTEADGAIAGPSTVLCLAEMENFSTLVKSPWTHSVNAPGNRPASSGVDPYCTINGCCRFASSMYLPSSQLVFPSFLLCLASPSLLTLVDALLQFEPVPAHL